MAKHAVAVYPECGSRLLFKDGLSYLSGAIGQREGKQKEYVR